MKVLVVTSTPNSSGLTAACGEAARQGIVDGRSRARVINLNEFRIDRCKVCNNGWGTCSSKHTCCIEDDFAQVKEMFEQAEGYVWTTPVYFGEPSEPMKAFFDRLRRCEATKPGQQKTIAANKPTVCIAAAGGSGNGATACLSAMERWIQVLKAEPVDLIPVTQKTREYQVETIHDALVSMCTPKVEERDDMPLSARRGRKPQKRRFNRRGSQQKKSSS